MYEEKGYLDHAEMNECMHEWINERHNEWKNECMNAYMNDWIHACMHELMHELMHKRIAQLQKTGPAHLAGFHDLTLFSETKPEVWSFDVKATAGHAIYGDVLNNRLHVSSSLIDFGLKHKRKIRLNR